MITLFKDKSVYSYTVDELKEFLKFLNSQKVRVYKQDIRDDMDGYYPYFKMGKNNSINHYISGLGWVANYKYCKGHWLMYLATIKQIWEREQKDAKI